MHLRYKQEYLHLVILHAPQKLNQHFQQRLCSACKTQRSFVQGQFFFLIVIIVITAVQLTDTVKKVMSDDCQMPHLKEVS